MASICFTFKFTCGELPSATAPVHLGPCSLYFLSGCFDKWTYWPFLTTVDDFTEHLWGTDQQFSHMVKFKWKTLHIIHLSFGKHNLVELWDTKIQCYLEKQVTSPTYTYPTVVKHILLTRTKTSCIRITDKSQWWLPCISFFPPLNLKKI